MIVFIYYFTTQKTGESVLFIRIKIKAVYFSRYLGGGGRIKGTESLDGDIMILPYKT